MPIVKTERNNQMKLIDARIEDSIAQKKKKYSRSQIENAIKFWNMVLENKSPLIDDLVSVFDYYYVFMGMPLVPTQNNLSAIYDVVNKNLFDNKLHKRSFAVNDELCVKQNSLLGYVYEYYSDDDRKTDVLISEKCIDSENSVHYPPMICLSHKFMHSAHLVVSLASLIAHEMIHQWCVENGNALKEIYDCREKDKEYDKHGPDFIKFMNLANSKHGLNIEIHGTSIDQSNIDAIRSLKSFAGDDYMAENELNKGLVDGKQIKKMFFA